MDEPFLSIENLFGGYGKEPVINGVSLRVAQKDFLGIIGPNGSGKTTLLRLVSRTLQPLKGEILLQGNNIRALGLKQFCRKAAFVPQDILVNFSFSVREIVLMGRIPHLSRLQAETKKDLSAAQEAMELTDTARLAQKRINCLSAGERQMVFIARSLCQQPDLLLLDEPTSHLDIGHQIQALDLLRRLNRNYGLTIIAVLHDLNLASQYCNRLALMREGRIFLEGTPEEVLTYQNIEAVYKTVVVVNKNPLNQKPYMFLVPGEN